MLIKLHILLKLVSLKLEDDLIKLAHYNGLEILNNSKVIADDARLLTPSVDVLVSENLQTEVPNVTIDESTSLCVIPECVSKYGNMMLMNRMKFDELTLSLVHTNLN